jgi:TIR domain
MATSTNDLFLFVSHVSADRAAALEIVAGLEQRGIRCWIAPRDVRPGSHFDDEIADALDACRAMLLVFSKKCNENEYIRREVTVAGKNRKDIIPVRIEKDAQPLRGLLVRLCDLHWIDGSVCRERAIDELEHFSIRLGVTRVCEISFAFVFGNLFEKRGDCSPKFLDSSRLHFA